MAHSDARGALLAQPLAVTSHFGRGSRENQFVQVIWVRIWVRSLTLLG